MRGFRLEANDAFPGKLLAATACSQPIAEFNKVQELLVKLDKASNKLSHTSAKLLTMPKSERRSLTSLSSLKKTGRSQSLSN